MMKIRDLTSSILLALVLFIFVLAPASSRAEDSLLVDQIPNPNVVACLTAIKSLDLRYRQEMNSQCLVTALELCAAVDAEGGSCLEELNTSMRRLGKQVMPLMPTKLEGGGFRAYTYERALVRLASAFDKAPSCERFDGYDLAKEYGVPEGYGATMCEYLELGGATTDLIYRAGMAGVSLP
jgi:hypothetical protein